MKHSLILFSKIIFLGVFLLGCTQSGGQEQTAKSLATPRSILTITPKNDVNVIPKAKRPNILFILTDDLDAELGTIEYMPNLKKLLVAQGLNVDDFFITDSLCCPSRSTFLRGQYTHNHGVYTNNPPDGGFERFYLLGNESSTLATWLQAAGYKTVFMGKYLNGYPFPEDRTHVPVGWTGWYSPVKGRPYVGFKYALNENGSLVDYQEKGQPVSEYLTDVLSRKAVDFIKQSKNDSAPFFIYLATFAPHEPAKPAPRHAGMFSDLKAPRTPSYNELDVSDKPGSIRNNPLLKDAQIQNMNQLFRSRVRSMQAVDEMIAQLVSALEETGQLDNTYIVFTSDNGFHLGQHRLLPGKGTPYEEDIHVPFIIRGPGIEPGTSLQGYLTGNVDVAPTFADLAGVIPPSYEDGRSMTPLFGSDKPSKDDWRSGYLLEFYGYGNEDETASSSPSHEYASLGGLLEPPDLGQIATSSLTPQFLGLRTLRYLYVEYDNGSRELYDLEKDPYEMDNIASHADPLLLSQLSDWLHALAKCSGSQCVVLDRGLNR